MNILPMIIGFIMIFSCLSLTFQKEAQAVSLIERSLNGAIRVENELHNRLEQRKYLKQAHVRNQPKTTGEKKKRPYFSLRAICPPIKESKLDLSVLFDETLLDLHQHPVYLIAAKLLRHLYEDTSVVPKENEKEWETQILDAIIEMGKQVSKPEELAELFPKDPELQQIYYKILKGTNQYQLGKTKKGIAPLGEFFCIGSGKKEEAIHFCFASPPLLEALFGQKIAEQIMAKERKHWDETGKKYFSQKEDLQEFLLQDTSQSLLFTQLEPFFSFSKQIPPKNQIAGKDRITGLVITWDIP